MRSVVGLSLSAILGLCAAVACAQGATSMRTGAPADRKSEAFFETRIRPLLAEHCYSCHSGKNSSGGLKLDSAASFFKGGAAGSPVVPGHPEKSLLITAIGYTSETLKMPPQGRLKPQAIADLTAWIKMGAPWGRQKDEGGRQKDQGPGRASSTPRVGGPGGLHWAFQPPTLPAVPKVRNSDWVCNPIDAFVLSGLEAKGLAPAPPADRRTLLRRGTYDLTGLPPSEAEIAAFLADRSPDAWERVVDRLLASPAYGERWGRHWLDVVRYADSNGLDENTAFGNAWRYRDYVIRSLNQDKPYDEFIKEQIAGDLVWEEMRKRGNGETPEPKPISSFPHSPISQSEALTATGFLCLGPKVLAEPDKQKMVMDIVDEQIDTTGKAFLGLTLGCARCHDHKFDPISTKDYYGLAGIFKSTRTMATLNTVARVLERPLADAEALLRQEAHSHQVQEKQKELKEATDRLNAEASAAVVGSLGKYLLVGLEAAVDPAPPSGEPDLHRPGIVLVEAEKFARGDVKVTTEGYGEGIGIIESAGRSAAFTEYEIVLPGAGEYHLAIRYASAETRPVKVLLDGRLLKAGAAGRATGGFNPPEQQWQMETTFAADAGKHVLRIEQAAGALPHIDRIALIPPAPAVAPAASTGRPRSGRPSDLAKAYGLDADTLRRSAAYLLRSRLGSPDPNWEPWHLLTDLSQATFEEDAARRIAEWRTSGRMKSWHPAVAALFEGDPPKSLADVAARYQALFARIDQAWQQRVRISRRPPSRLRDAGDEALRQVLYGADGVFGLNDPTRFYSRESAAAVAKLRTELAALEKAAPEAVPTVIAVEDEKTVGNVRVHLRGNHLTLGDEVARRFPVVLAGEKQPPIDGTHSGRLELANWIADPKNPLTARVLVNRVWLHHFGEGLVRTPDDFGTRGERPTHPELLDWLAVRFAQGSGFGVQGSGSPSPLNPEPRTLTPYSLKSLHRLILLSSTYRMSTRYDARAARVDPENRLLWRANRRRLEVEAIRDGMLAVSGKLDRTMGGSLLTTANFAYVTNDQSANAAQYDVNRRSIYLPVIRNAVFDVFQVFDFVEPSVLNGKRASTTVAPQALFLLNGQFVLGQSRALAEQLLSGPGPDDAARLAPAYVKAYGRPATPDEVAAALGYIRSYEERLAQTEKDPAKRRLAAWTSFCQILFASNEFLTLN